MKIVQSILDTDQYKLTMQQAVCQLYPRAWARYEFINRGKTKFPEGFDKALKENAHEMASLKLTKEEKDFLKEKCPYLTPVYLDFLAGYRFDPRELTIIQKYGDLEVNIEGPWYRTILWETPLMATISELYYELTGQKEKFLPWGERWKRNLAKAKLFKENEMYLLEFGTRRRASFENHNEVVSDFRAAGQYLRGTSNPYLAMIYDLIPIGTQAHEWFQFHAAKFGFRMANSTALGRWVDVYHGNLGIALSDTYGTDEFFRSFGTMYAKLFDGVRQDSGDPFVFLEKAIAYYKKLQIDPKSKVLVFSDFLTPEVAVEIHKAVAGRALTSYGIGTNLTNDVGVLPLNIVIKMVACRPDETWPWTPVVKLSDDSGKHTGDKGKLSECKSVLGIS